MRRLGFCLFVFDFMALSLDNMANKILQRVGSFLWPVYNNYFLVNIFECSIIMNLKLLQYKKLKKELNLILYANHRQKICTIVKSGKNRL